MYLAAACTVLVGLVDHRSVAGHMRQGHPQRIYRNRDNKMRHYRQGILVITAFSHHCRPTCLAILSFFLFFSHASFVFSQENPSYSITVDDLLQRHFDAVGGKLAIENIQHLSLVGQLNVHNSGIKSEIEQYWSRSGIIWNSYNRHEMQITNCLEKTHGQQDTSAYRDALGITRPPATRDVPRDELEVYRAWRDALVSPFLCYLEKQCQVSLHTPPADPRHLAFKVTYNDGVTDHVLIDPTTFLVKEVRRFLNLSGGFIYVHEFDLYRSVGGIKLPHYIHAYGIFKKPVQNPILAARATFQLTKIDSAPETLECYSGEPRRGFIEIEEVKVSKIKFPDHGYTTIASTPRILLQVAELQRDDKTIFLFFSDSTAKKLSYHDALFTTFSDVFCKIFPACVIANKTTTPSQFDFLVRLEHSGKFTLEHHLDWARFTTFTLDGTLTFSNSNGEEIDIIRYYHTERPINDGVILVKSAAKARAEVAIKRFIEDLINKIYDSSAIRENLKIFDEYHQQPSKLATSLLLTDTLSNFPNRSLDAGESAKIAITVVNSGPGPAIDTYLRISSEATDILVDADHFIGNIPPGEQREISVPIRANLKIKNGNTNLLVDTIEKRGYGAPKIQLSIPTAALIPPSLHISDIVLNDKLGQTRGDGDGRPANGETLEATLRIENHGPGDAIGVQFQLVNPPIQVLTPFDDLARIPAGEARERVALLHIPPGYIADQLTLQAVATDKRGASVGHAETEKTWSLVRKRPALEAEYRLYDGTSPGSSGDGNGIASNGEKIEIGIVVVNQGNLMAREVQLSLKTQENAIVTPAEPIGIGDLPPGARAAEQRIPVSLPRHFGALEGLDSLTFRLHFEQADFPAYELEHKVGFEPRQPSLEADISFPEAIVRGRDGSLTIQIWNYGDLDAEEVILETETAALGLELYEPERGMPAQRHEMTIGKLAAGDRPVIRRLIALARQDAALSLGELRLRIRQKDFPAFEKHLTFRIEDRLEIAPVEPPAPLPVRATKPISTEIPAISFLGTWQNGQQVKTETIMLAFEIQAVAGTVLRSVRLEHRTDDGSRIIPLGAPSAREPSGSRLVEKYEVPVYLVYGPNHLIVTAVTENDTIGDRRLSLNRAPDTGRFWVVVIGIGKYSDEKIRDLGYARQDSQAIYDYFRSALTIPETQLFLLLDDQATNRQIMELLGETLPKNANNPEDTVIIYFAGHGMSEPDLGSVEADGLAKYLVPADADREHLFSTGINMEVLGRIFGRIAAERVVVLADTCFSGAVGGRTIERQEAFRSSLTEEFLDRLVTGRGRLILTASDANEVAEERAALGHGVFTYYLLQGLEGQADVDCNRVVTADELYRYVFQNVSKETGGRQNPVRKASSAQIGEIAIGRSRQTCTPRK